MQTNQSYALALLMLYEDQQNADQDGVQENLTTPPGLAPTPLGMARRYDIARSIFNIAAHRLLPPLIEHSHPTIAGQFMAQLAQCNNSAAKDLVDSLNDGSPLGPGDWATAVHEKLIDGDNSPLADLASYYLNNLLIPFINPGGKKTPSGSPSENLSPDFRNTDNTALLALVTSASSSRGRQASLKELVLRRDGRTCPISGLEFTKAVASECAHILPFSIHDKTPVHSAIEMFTGKEVKAEMIQSLINSPSNAINLQSDAHRVLDKNLAWGIEAKFDDDKYYFRVVRQDYIPPWVNAFIQDGGEIKFGGGERGADPIALPNPQFCNLHLAIARVFAASGFAEVVDGVPEEPGVDGTASMFFDLITNKLMLLPQALPPMAG